MIMRPANDNLTPFLLGIFDRLGAWAVIEAQSSAYRNPPTD
jgi:hypothetical protein